MRVHRHPHRRPAGGNGPPSDYGPRLDIDDRNFVLVHKVDVDLARPIGGEELRRPAQFNRHIDLSTLGIDVRLERHQYSLVTRDGQDVYRTHLPLSHIKRGIRKTIYLYLGTGTTPALDWSRRPALKSQ